MSLPVIVLQFAVLLACLVFVYAHAHMCVHAYTLAEEGSQGLAVLLSTLFL